MPDGFEAEIAARIREDWGRFTRGEMAPDEADGYRQMLRDNRDLLDDDTRRQIDEGHLLDAPPPPVLVQPAGPVLPLDTGSGFSDQGGAGDPEPLGTSDPAPSSPGRWSGLACLIPVIGGVIVIILVSGVAFAILGGSGGAPKTGGSGSAAATPTPAGPGTPTPTAVVIAITNLDIWYYHNGPGDSCVGYAFIAAPFPPGASARAMLSGPGALGGGASRPQVDASGRGSGRAAINLFGDYVLIVFIDYAGGGSQGSAKLTVTGTQGPRPCPPL